MSQLLLYPTPSWPENLRNKTGLVVRAAMVSRIMRGRKMAPHFRLSNGATDVRPGCKTQRITPRFDKMEVTADLACSRPKKLECFRPCIVGHVNCCLQCGLAHWLQLQVLNG
ncbi:hypothetical protein PoB_006552300 [Plakobranchus ocellatus]|uniref:Uncharacterized protein n=1 Tax=Plakobranchus ocellatus TaxID=259542 RepID=A0AAV4D4D7_9GAST|nr:hypothetical protein PoB_006552300 [Plakobranchus ocellatus]